MYNQTNTNIPSLKKAAFILLCLFGANVFFSQSISGKTANFVLESDAAKSTCTIAFTSLQEIQNMLVLVTDNKGNTVFLENKYRFTGTYRRIVDLKDFAKGEFEVKIINDEEQIKRIVTMK
jgi:hypothetical protein